MPLGFYKKKACKNGRPLLLRVKDKSKTVFLLKLIYTAAGVNQLLLSCKKRMALRTYFYVHSTLSGHCCKGLTASALCRYLGKIRMDTLFHCMSPSFRHQIGDFSLFLPAKTAATMIIALLKMRCNLFFHKKEAISTLFFGLRPSRVSGPVNVIDQCLFQPVSGKTCRSRRSRSLPCSFPRSSALHSCPFSSRALCRPQASSPPRESPPRRRF